MNQRSRLEDGFLNKWKLSAPVGDRVVTCCGVCTVQAAAGLIYRNEVYFDTLPLIAATRDWNEPKVGSTKALGRSSRNGSR